MEHQHPMTDRSPGCDPTTGAADRRPWHRPVIEHVGVSTGTGNGTDPQTAENTSSYDNLAS